MRDECDAKINTNPCGWPAIHMASSEVSSEHRRINLTAKWNKQKIELVGLEASLCIDDLKLILESETRVPPERQKIIGLK